MFILNAGPYFLSQRAQICVFELHSLKKKKKTQRLEVNTRPFCYLGHVLDLISASCVWGASRSRRAGEKKPTERKRASSRVQITAERRSLAAKCCASVAKCKMAKVESQQSRDAVGLSLGGPRRIGGSLSWLRTNGRHRRRLLSGTILLISQTRGGSHRSPRD